MLACFTMTDSSLQHVVIYTDGACSPNPGTGGWGAVLISQKHQQRKELFGAEADTTNNRMELTAAVEALSALKQPCRVELYTDSSYLRNAFELEGPVWCVLIRATSLMRLSKRRDPQRPAIYRRGR